MEAKTVDARGLACPQPVILTKQALDGGADAVTVLVDNEAAVGNVSKMGTAYGCNVTVEGAAPDFKLNLVRVGEKEAAAPATGETVFLITSDVLGQGSEELGLTLRRSFLHVLTEVDCKPTRLVLMNSAVKLVVEGSPVLEDLKALDRAGVGIAACGLCLDYLNLKDKVAVGEVGNMYDFVETFMSGAKVVSI